MHMWEEFPMKYLMMAVLGTAMLAPTAMAESYPLICRGGPSMRITTAHDVPDGVRTGDNSMVVYFRAARMAANPGPGECVWMDRAFRPGEPESFTLKGPVEFSFQVYGNGQIARDGSGWRLNPEGSGAQANDWRQIVNAVLNGGVFTVQVYSAGSTMVVTRVGP
jgi:hypothetical protein